MPKKYTNRKTRDDSLYTSSVETWQGTDHKTVFLWKPVSLDKLMEILKYEGGPVAGDEVMLPALTLRWEVEKEDEPAPE